MYSKEDKEKLQSGDAEVRAKLRVEPQFPWFKMRRDVSIICGDRKIIVRAATGEQGSKGPFPFVTLTDGSGSSGFCVQSEAVFDELWDKLKELMLQ